MGILPMSLTGVPPVCGEAILASHPAKTAGETPAAHAGKMPASQRWTNVYRKLRRQRFKEPGGEIIPQRSYPPEKNK